MRRILRPSLRRFLPPPAVGGVLLLALALRLYRAEAQSLWYDEGTTAALVGRSLTDIARSAARDIHPPLYYWLAAVWARAFGDGVFALRALSALLGTVVAGGIAGIADRLWGRPAALAAGLAAASSPYLVWYSQEVRMYGLAAALAVLLVWLSLDRLDDSGAAATSRPAWNGWRLWTAGATAALYTHYFAGASAVAAADAVLVVGWLFAARAGSPPSRRTLAGWLVAHAVAAAAFLPWLAVAWPAIRDWPALGPVVAAADVMREAVATFALGQRVPPALMRWTGVVVLVAIAGIFARGRDGTRRASTLALAWLSAPLAMMALQSLVRPAWNPKFVIGAAPAFELLLGAGAAAIAAAAGSWVRRQPQSRTNAVWASVSAALVLGAVALGAVVRLRAGVLEAMYFDPAYQRDDYRGIAARIDALAGPVDAVILNAPTQIEVFDYYDRGRHFAYPLPLQRPADDDRTRAALEGIGRDHRDVFGVLWATGESDPNGTVERWLNHERYKVFDEWHGNVRLALWAAARAPMAERPQGLPVVFGDGIAALARLATSPLDIAVGDTITIDATWSVPAAQGATAARETTAARSSAPEPADYTVFLHLVDAAGRVVAQRDMRPRGGTASTAAWIRRWRDAGAGVSGGRAEVDRIGLRVPADAPAGRYALHMGLYGTAIDGSDGARLSVTSGADPAASPYDAYVIEPVYIARPGE